MIIAASTAATGDKLVIMALNREDVNKIVNGQLFLVKPEETAQMGLLEHTSFVIAFGETDNHVLRALDEMDVTVIRGGS